MFYLRPQDIERQDELPAWPELFNERARQARDYRLERFYRAGTISANTPLSQVPFVAMDFETTGLNSKKDAIVSIGLVPFDVQRVRCKDAKHWIVNPHKPMSDDAVVIHGITHSEVQTAPDLLLVLDELLAALAGSVVVVHHKAIERGFLAAALQARLNEGIVFPVVDTMELEARLHRNKPLGLFGLLKQLAHFRRAQPASIRLADSRDRYHLPFYQPHHALTDALATAELLQAQIAHHYQPDTQISEIWG
ncbi:3'-5' exonuclease [Oceanisphaera sp. W20_SRM_FM3]|uniref:3'-5' exonuclease n=1 Tax=Oceanisphaera sp. W20_SRM_FM3 TaxID=3240267 RepID=UPI003F9D3471